MGGPLFVCLDALATWSWNDLCSWCSPVIGRTALSISVVPVRPRC